MDPGGQRPRPRPPPPAPPGHTPADGQVHLQDRGVLPLQGRQAAEQVGGPQVQEADQHGQGQQNPLLRRGHRALQQEGRQWSRRVPRLAGAAARRAPLPGWKEGAKLPHSKPPPPRLWGQTTQEGGGDTGVRKRTRNTGGGSWAQAGRDPPQGKAAGGGWRGGGAVTRDRPNSAGGSDPALRAPGRSVLSLLAP